MCWYSRYYLYHVQQVQSEIFISTASNIHCHVQKALYFLSTVGTILYEVLLELLISCTADAIFVRYSIADSIFLRFNIICIYNQDV